MNTVFAICMVTYLFIVNIDNILTEKNQELRNLEAKSDRPKALYFRTENPNLHRVEKKKAFLSDISILEEIAATESPTTTLVFEYNDNTDTEGMSNATTEYSNGTDITELPEISLFSKPPNVATTEAPTKKVLYNTKKEKYCGCDLTYGACDVNCCCDDDCSEYERAVFTHCLQMESHRDDRYCYSRIFHYKNNTSSKVQFESDNLFCILKDNLPAKRTVGKQPTALNVNEAENILKHSYKWQNEAPDGTANTFNAKSYIYGDSIWFLNYSDATLLDIPSSSISNYCHSRKPLQFLKNTKMKCIVNTSKLEMFSVLKLASTNLIAGIPLSMQNMEGLNVKNCSHVLCINWTIIACKDNLCEKFNETIHSVYCNDVKCINIATKLEYVFHCNGTKIKKAEIILHLVNISSQAIYVQQEINVRYYLEKENNTIKMPIDLSGNPGYLIGKPIIRGKIKSISNDSNTSKPLAPMDFLIYPKNIGGVCQLSNQTYEEILFGINVNAKCKYNFILSNKSSNATKTCYSIQKELFDFLKLQTENNRVSTVGNPNFSTNNNWLEMVHDIGNKNNLHGAYKNNDSLACYNFVSMFNYEFIYANVSRPDVTSSEADRTILRSSVQYKESQVMELNMKEPNFIITTSVQFFDVTRPVLYEYARGPRLYIHLPSDFFYPFTSNRCSVTSIEVLVLVLSVISYIICEILSLKIN